MSHLLAGLGWSVHAETAVAITQAIAQALPPLQGYAPSVAFVTTTVEHDAQRVFDALRAALPGTAIHGITTSLGLLGREGVISGTDGVVGVLLLAGSGGVRVAVGAAPISGDPRAAAQLAAQQLLQQGDGVLPRVILFNASPGHEEALLQTLAEQLPGVPAFGGSAADHAIAGEWSVFTSSGPLKDAVSLVGIFGAVAVGGAIRAPYVPTGHHGQVTASSGRTLHELDGRPAADVLNEWLDGALTEQIREGGNILAQTALRPLGIQCQTEAGVHWLTIHPAHINQVDRSVSLFACAAPGQTLCVMEGSVSGLTTVLGDLCSESLARAGLLPHQVGLAILIYCAGCAGAIGAELDAGLRAQLADRLGNAPLLGMCTFGEQGHVPGFGNCHQDLSVSLLLIGDPASAS